MPSVASASETSKSGIATTSSGERHIPSSTRPDGSVRKEIRVRPGYRPPEDVEVYKNRTAEAWKSRGSGGVPGAEGLGSSGTAGGSVSKNAKRREARKKATASTTSTGQAQPDAPEASQADEEAASTKEEPRPEVNEATQEPEAERAKEARKLAKKLRQARELKERKDKGEGLLPEQFEKVIRINELIRQLDGLGFDLTGEKKESEP